MEENFTEKEVYYPYREAAKSVFAVLENGIA